MKLVTFQFDRGAPRAGALIDDGQTVVDLDSAFHARHKKRTRHLASVLAIMEGGNEALDIASTVLARLPKRSKGRLDRAAVKLLAPVPSPPQMRDFLCFEKHLIQGFDAVRRMRAQQSPDPEAALAEMTSKGQFAVPQTWYERPIFYHPSRFAVCGHDTDVPWPSYCQALDFELEFGCYIGAPGKDIARGHALDYIFWQKWDNSGSGPSGTYFH